MSTHKRSNTPSEYEGKAQWHITIFLLSALYEKANMEQLQFLFLLPVLYHQSLLLWDIDMCLQIHTELKNIMYVFKDLKVVRNSMK